MGIDVLTRGLAWAYPYRSEALTQTPPAFGGRRGRAAPPRVVSEWKAPATIVHRERVIFTAPDESSIHCLNLRDGSLLWKAKRGDENLYLAGVIADRVLIVGKQSCRASTRPMARSCGNSRRARPPAPAWPAAISSTFP